MMKLGVLFIFVVLVGGCKPEKVRTLKLFEDVIPEHFEKDVQELNFIKSSGVIISLDKYSVQKEILLSSLVDSIDFVCLDSSDDALLGSINKFIRKHEDIYLLDRYKTKSIKKFSIDGKFLFNIGRYGEAPGEYIEPTDFIVSDSLIVVYDQFKSLLNYYTLEGQFIRAKRVPFLCLRFCQLSDNKFVFCTLDADNQHMKKIENYSIFETDSNFVINHRGFYRKRGLYSSIISDFNFAEMNGKLYYHPPFNDKIYEVSAGGMYKEIVDIDFASKKLPDEFLLNDNWDKFQEESDRDRYFFFPGEFLFLENMIYFTYINQHKVYRCFYLLDDNQLTVSSFIKNDIYPIFPFGNIVGVDNNSIIGYVYPNNIVGARNSNSPEEWQKMVGKSSAEISKKIKEEDNPVLVWFHMKNSY